MMSVEGKDRPSIQQIREHVWMKDGTVPDQNQITKFIRARRAK
jgi:hypothetical protein